MFIDRSSSLLVSLSSCRIAHNFLLLHLFEHFGIVTMLKLLALLLKASSQSATSNLKCFCKTHMLDFDINLEHFRLMVFAAMDFGFSWFSGLLFHPTAALFGVKVTLRVRMLPWVGLSRLLRMDSLNVFPWTLAIHWYFFSCESIISALSPFLISFSA